MILQKYVFDLLDDIHIWQVSLQLSCRGIFKIWMWPVTSTGNVSLIEKKWGKRIDRGTKSHHDANFVMTGNTTA